jgi:hypothetical protein
MISLLGSLLNLKGLEDSRYTLLGTHGPYEVRQYHRVATAKVQVQGDLLEAFEEGQRLLMEYLAGSNLRLEKVPYSAVFTQTPKQNTWDIGVMLNFIRATSEIPRPVNRLVRIDEISPRRTAVLRCNGIHTKELFYEREEELKRWINLKCWEENGVARLIHFNNPVSLPFIKDKEILIDVIHSV